MFPGINVNLTYSLMEQVVVMLERKEVGCWHFFAYFTF